MHIYIRWQLRNRRCAAIIYGGALRALAEWVNREPSEDDLGKYNPKQNSPKIQVVIVTRLTTLLDYIIPFPYATLHQDVTNDKYPKWLAEAIQQQENDSTGAIKAEWLVTLGSFVSFIAIAIRTLYPT